MSQSRRPLYPAISARKSYHLDVGDGHCLYVEESGRADGLPVIGLHGGPGGGAGPVMRRYFDPKRYRIILFDQRGCGRSRPHSSLDANTTWHLVGDIERIRDHLGIDKWVVFGGSWGATLSLAYAQTHPDRALGLVLRGVFLCSREELDWFYKDGASRIFPDAWERFIAPLDANERNDILQSYYTRLMNPDVKARKADAIAWADWESSVLSFTSTGQPPAQSAARADAISRIEAHYFVNKGFFDEDDQLLAGMEKIKHLPGFIAQGRYDVVTPPSAAWKIAKAWNGNARLELVSDAGHSAGEPGLVDALVRATDQLADRFG